MVFRFLLFLCFISSVVLVSTASAQALPESDPQVAAEETVEVTASRVERARFEAARSVEVVERGQIDEIQAHSLPELIGDVPGVYLQKTNPGAGSPFVRGLVGPQNLILIDGIRFNTSTFRTGPNQYLHLIDPFGLDRLEVVRGPSSVLYGSGAMGGVLHAITWTPRASLGPLSSTGRAKGTLSSADVTRSGAFRLTTAGHGLAVSAGFHFASLGTLRAGGGFHEPASDYLASYWNAKLVYSPTGSWSMVATYLGAGVLDAGRTDQLGRGDLRFYDNHDNLAYMIFRYPGDGLFRRIRLSLSYHRLSEVSDHFSCAIADQGGPADLDACLNQDRETLIRIRRYRDSVEVLGSDGNLGVNFWDDRLRLNAGYEFYQDLVSSRLERAQAESGFVFAEQTRGNFSDGAGYSTLGLYLHGAAALLDLGEDSGQFRASAGLRYSSFTAIAGQVPEIGDVDYEYDGLVASVGVGYLLAGRLHAYFSFVQGFRAPNLQETTVLGDTGDRFEIPNPDLGPEKSHTLELGLRLNLEPIELDAAYHYAFLTGAITQQATTYEGQAFIDGKQVTRLVNGDEGAIQGADLSIRARLWRLSLFANASWTEGQVTTERGTSPARRIPPLFGSAGLRYAHPGGAWFAEAFVRWALRQDRLHPADERDLRICETARFSGQLQDDCDGTPGWVTANLRTGYRPTRSFRLDAALTNLTDAQYRQHGSGIYAPGIDFRLSATLDF
jgi:hemoglobin/transferrin/lactoferrin receptor protein